MHSLLRNNSTKMQAKKTTYIRVPKLFANGSNKDRHRLHMGPEQRSAMEDLKQAVVTAPCLRPIDYHSDRWVILAVDSSCIATGFILFQLGADGKHYPSHFGSITWNERESRYSQAKIEIYGLWCTLQAYRLYIIGIKNSPFSYKICNITTLSVHTTLVRSPQVHDGLTWADILLRAACSRWALVY